MALLARLDELTRKRHVEHNEVFKKNGSLFVMHAHELAYKTQQFATIAASQGYSGLEINQVLVCSNRPKECKSTFLYETDYGLQKLRTFFSHRQELWNYILLLKREELKPFFDAFAFFYKSIVIAALKGHQFFDATNGGFTLYDERLQDITKPLWETLKPQQMYIDYKTRTPELFSDILITLTMRWGCSSARSCCSTVDMYNAHMNPALNEINKGTNPDMVRTENLYRKLRAEPVQQDEPPAKKVKTENPPDMPKDTVVKVERVD